MYGLPNDIDLDFFVGASLIQVCIGENEVIANLHPDISVMIASNVRLDLHEGEIEAFDDAEALGVALLPLLGGAIVDASGAVDGTLRLTWEGGTTIEILDSYREFESYTVRHGAELIVV